MKALCSSRIVCVIVGLSLLFLLRHCVTLQQYYLFNYCGNKCLNGYVMNTLKIIEFEKILTVFEENIHKISKKQE